MNPIRKGFFFEGEQGESLQFLAKQLWDRKFVVYLSGGCVRDALLGRSPKDFDIVTDASIQDLQTIFKKIVLVGAQFGIVRVIINKYEFEVARFRSDGPYIDGRHPQSVQFMGPSEDAQRRDFTINALFYDLESEKILDYVEGQKDLNKKVLRSVGNPHKRFSEDYLRLLRLLRFSCQLEFKIEAETLAAADELSFHLGDVSGERLRIETIKSLQENPQKALLGFLRWKLPSLFFPKIPWKANTDWHLSKELKEGWILSQWILNFYRDEALKCIEVVSATKWNYSVMYLKIIKELSQRFKLSRNDEHLLKVTGSTPGWGAVWNLLRPGTRFYIAQTDDFIPIYKCASNLNIWSSNQFNEVEHWSRKERLRNFIAGEEVNFVVPEKRGLVLMEALYLQYEGKLKNREESLAWLNELSTTSGLDTKWEF